MITTFKTRIWFTPRITEEVGMVTVICDELRLAASAETQEQAIDRLKQTILSYAHALQRSPHQWERALRESKIDWQPLSVESKPGEIVLDVPLTPKGDAMNIDQEAK